MVKKDLYKIPEEKQVCGVCAGFAEYMNADVSAVRIITFLIIVLTFPLGLLAYFLACIIMPSRPPLEVVSRGSLESMTKAEIKEAAERRGIELSTNDLKEDMIDQFMEEVER